MVEWKEHFKVAIGELGSQPKLAEAMGCSQSKISWLLVIAEQISAEDALAVHRATSGKVTASQLRPDLWPTNHHIPIEPYSLASTNSEREQAKAS